MRTVIWDQITSRVSQGSILDPMMILIYINDMLDSYTNFLADDVKLMRKMRNSKVAEGCNKTLTKAE